MLELKGISFAAGPDGKDREIIRNLNLTVGSGRFVVVTGPNGGGKSTLAKLIAGIVTPTEGQILLDGEDITGKTITERARMGIGFAFQQPVRFKGLTVLDLLRIAAGKSLTISAARSMPHSPAASSSASRSRPCSREASGSRSLTSRRPASTCGASRISSASSRRCATRGSSARSS